MKAYLSTLNTRNKWVEEKRNIAPGGVVLMVDPGKPSRALAFGSNSRRFPGPDGKVRVARVRTGGKDYVRPITKLFPLERYFQICTKNAEIANFAKNRKNRKTLKS